MLGFQCAFSMANSVWDSVRRSTSFLSNMSRVSFLLRLSGSQSGSGVRAAGPRSQDVTEDVIRADVKCNLPPYKVLQSC